MNCFNGKKTLVRGNHDRVFSDDDLKPYFHTIIPDGGGFYFGGSRKPISFRGWNECDP
jgi:hypothetical protein